MRLNTPKKAMARFVSDSWTFFTDEKLVIGNSNADCTALCNYKYKVISIRVGIR